MNAQTHIPSPPSTHDQHQHHDQNHDKSQTRNKILEALLAEHRGVLERQAIRHSQRPEGAEEALQDACVQFLAHFEGEGLEHALPWMLLTTKRCAWAIARVELRTPAERLAPTDYSDRDEQRWIVRDERPETAAFAERRLEHTETVARFERLKPDERTALILLGLGCSYEEIGTLRGWTYTKVNRCICEGRAALRQAERPAEAACPAPAARDTSRSWHGCAVRRVGDRSPDGGES
jgi:DNA-directed RNA polymerase specialized sigma24 family protein